MQNHIEEEKPIFVKHFITNECANACHLLFYPEKVIIGHLTFDEEVSVSYSKSAIFHYGKCLQSFLDFLIETYTKF